MGEGTGGIPLSVAELIAERDLEQLRERGYVGSAAVTADAPSSMLERPGLTAVNSPVVSVQPSVMSDNRPILTSPVHASVQRDRDASVPTVTTGQQAVHMTPRVGPFPDSFTDARNQRAITTTAGRYSSTAPEVVNRRCGSPELSEDGQLIYRERRRSEDQGIRTSVDTDKTLLYDVGQYISVGSASVSQSCGVGVCSTPLICTTVYSSSRVDTTHVVWSDGYRNATGSSMSGELPVCRSASRLGRVSPISTVCGTLLGSECSSILSEPTAQPRVTQYTMVDGSSSRTLVAARSFPGELNCVDAKRRDGRDSAASGSYCSLLFDGMTGQHCVGPAPSVEDWMYEQRASRDVREGSYGHGDGSTSPWFDRSPGRPPYGRYRSVDALYWSSDGQYRSPVGQRRSMVSHLDSPYQSTDGPSAGLLDSLFAGQVRATTGLNGLTTGHHRREKTIRQ